jgi:hypothetical protein
VGNSISVYVNHFTIDRLPDALIQEYDVLIYSEERGPERVYAIESDDALRTTRFNYRVWTSDNVKEKLGSNWDKIIYSGNSVENAC